VHYRLRRARRRSIGFVIDDSGLTISAPRWVTLRDIEAAIREKERWIWAKLVQWREWRARRKLPTVLFADGGVLPFLGGEVVLRLGRAPDVTRLVETNARREVWVALPADAGEQQVRGRRASVAANRSAARPRRAHGAARPARRRQAQVLDHLVGAFPMGLVHAGRPHSS